MRATRNWALQQRNGPHASIDESYPNYILGLVATVQREMRTFYAPISELKHKKIKWDVLCKRSDNLVLGRAFHGDYVYAVTHTSAPKYRVVRTSVKHPDWEHAETVIAEAADSIHSITKSKHYLLVVYSNGVVGRLVKYDLAIGKTAEVRLPASGTVEVSCPDWKTDRCLVYMSTWISPLTIYDFDAQKNTFAKSIFNTDVSYPGFADLVSEEVEVPGHDGTMIPLSLIHKKGIPLDGSNSCLLFGYGAYGYSYAPFFNIGNNSLAARGVVVGIAHVQGRWRKGRGLVQGRFQDHQAQHLEGLHFLRGVSGEAGIYQSPQTRRNRHQCRRNPDQPRHYGHARTYLPLRFAMSGARTRCGWSSRPMVRSTRRNLAP